jgi:ribonucleoside-diphosphate reductase beta chain
MLSFEDDTPIAPTLGLQTIRIGSSVPPKEEGRVASQPPVSFTDVEARFTRVRAEDKRVINAKTDVHQRVPFKCKWAWDKYLAGCANHWMPQEVNMTATPPSGRTRTG